MADWLVDLRKNRNFALRQRIDGYQSNNQGDDSPVSYAYGAHCDLLSRIEYGACCPLTCPVVKHGVMLDDVERMTKFSKGMVKWDSASGIQMKRNTELRGASPRFAQINSDVLQRNIARLDAAFTGFWSHGRGFPSFQKAWQFNSFEYKPGQVKITSHGKGDGKTHNGSIYLPGIGAVKCRDSWDLPQGTKTRTVTVIREGGCWFISALIEVENELPETKDVEEIGGIVGLDVGINKLVSYSDGSFEENPRIETSKKMRRRLRIRQRRITRKQKGSNSKKKAAQSLAKLRYKNAQKRNGMQWQIAARTVKKADAVAVEDLNIKGMKKRCKPKRVKGRFMPNGQSAKRGLNRSIADAAWGGIFQKISWLALKAGKPVFKNNAAFSSQECSHCGHRSKENRSGEKFICENCGHVDHADTQASRTTAKRTGLVFPSNRIVKFVSTDNKSLPDDARGSHAGNTSKGDMVAPFKADASSPRTVQLSLFTAGESAEKQIFASSA